MGCTSMHASVHQSSFTKTWLSQYLTDCLREFHRVYKFSALSNKDELI